jgi:hypothetical protein
MTRITFCENIKKTYYDKCYDIVMAEKAEIELKFIALVISTAGIFYFKNNKNILYEIMFQLSYNSFLAVTKISNAYTKVKNYFISSPPKKIRYVYDEIKVIKDGVRHLSFETMETFKDASYLGNPNEYYDIHEIVETDSSIETSSASSTSTENTSDVDLDADVDASTSASSASSSYSEHRQSEPLFIMEKNESDDTLDFKTYDFIFHTNYEYSESNQSQCKNYTRIYRTFTTNDYTVDKNSYQVSNAEMIICTLEIDNDGKIYEIDLSYPYNFNVVGNVILDEKFMYWYMLKKHNYVIDSSKNYKITCITKDINAFHLDRSSGVRVHLNSYSVENTSSQ